MGSLCGYRQLVNKKRFKATEKEIDVSGSTHPTNRTCALTFVSLDYDVDGMFTPGMKHIKAPGLQKGQESQKWEEE